MTDLDTLFAHDDFVRRLARSLLWDADAADDVAQEVWLATVRRGAVPAEPRSWFAAMVGHLAARVRRDAAAVQRREQRAARPEAIPSAADVLAREAERRRVLEAVLALEELYRAPILLRWFDNLPLRHVARRLQVPAETARTRIKRGLALLRRRLDEAHGGDGARWRACLLPLWAARPEALALPLTPALFGVLLMSTKLKVAAAALLATAAAWTLWPWGPATGDGAAALASDASLPATAPAERSAAPTSPRPDRHHADGTLREPMAATLGALQVLARWSVDHTPAAGVWVRVARPDPEGRDELDAAEQPRDFVTGADGSFVVGEERPGRFSIELAQGLTTLAEVHAGAQTEVVLEIPPGIDVAGEVVDEAGLPVPGAGIWVGSGRTGHVAGTTAADGTFALRAMAAGQRLGAVAKGYAPSFLEWLSGPPGSTARLRLELGTPAALSGLVVDAEGRAVAGARVLIGPEHPGMGVPVAGKVRWQPWAVSRSTGAEGRFQVDELRPVPDLPILVLASGFGIWQGKLTLKPRERHELRVVLDRGVCLAGMVRDGSGRPVPGALVLAGAEVSPSLLQRSVRAGDDGSYRLVDLPAGRTFPVFANAPGSGQASARLKGAPGETVTWTPVLTVAGRIAGTLVADADATLPGWSVTLFRRFRGADFQVGQQKSDAAGRFVFTNLPAGWFVLRIHEPGAEQMFPACEVDVEPRSEDLRVPVPASARATAWITGTVVDGRGAPLGGAHVLLEREASSPIPNGFSEPGTGKFRLGPLAPGPCRLRIQVRDRPTVGAPAHELAAGETWDLGAVRVADAGFATLALRREDGRPPGKVELRFVRADGGWWVEQTAEAATLRSPPLLPGRWRLHATRGAVATPMPFEIRSGEETPVEVLLRAGIPCALSCAWEGRPPRAVRITVRASNGEVVHERVLVPIGDQRETLQLQLDPGAYAVEAVCSDGRRGEAHVLANEAAAPAAPVALELR